MPNAMLPHAASVALAGGVAIWGDRDALKRLIVERGLSGLANDTKWNELLGSMRAREGWRPSYRFKTIAGKFGDWDVEWSYHPPFPLMCVEWLDIATTEKRYNPNSPMRTETIDHGVWIAPLLEKIGFDMLAGSGLIRLFGYAPRNLERFED